jgi:hypothetical protein
MHRAKGLKEEPQIWARDNRKAGALLVFIKQASALGDI